MPKPNTTIKSDRHGPYVRAGGWLFRPQPTRLLTDPIVTTPEQRADAAKVTSKTRFSEGDLVRARHIGGSQLGRVGDDQGDEFWVTHGSYYDDEGKQVPSEQCWRDPS